MALEIALLAAWTLNASEPGYVAPETCRPCHAAIYESYSRTGMGRSFQSFGSAPAIENWSVRLPHKLSGRVYEFIRRAGEIGMLRSTGDGLVPVEKRIDYVIGSGNHSRTYAHRGQDGKLYELPVSWYSAEGGHWAMSPGYDRADHSDFRRPIPDSCLFCHNGYPSDANGGIASGIDCQRCHGPGAAHVTRRGPIVNPAKLPPERSMEICLQCHLESASRALPDSIRRHGRGPYSYRPGEPLGDFTIYFDRAAPAPGDPFTVNHSAYGLWQSRCFTQSAGRLTCTTCHNPHDVPRGAEADRAYTRACRTCHASTHPDRDSGCAACHMPLRRPDDAVHVLITDHRIRRIAEPGLTAPKPEQHGRYKGPVRLLYPRQLPGTPETRLYLAAGGLPATLAEFAALLEKIRPSQAGFYLQLGVAQRENNRPRDAARSFRQALERDPANREALLNLAETLVAAGEPGQAIKLLEAARPDPGLLNVLAVAYTGNARYADAEKTLRRALELDPESPASWLNLGVTLEAQRRTAAAAAAYRRALTLQPDLARARAFLRRLPKESGN